MTCLVVFNGRTLVCLELSKWSADDRQKAMIVCNIGTQPFIPAVYGVNAPL